MTFSTRFFVVAASFALGASTLAASDAPDAADVTAMLDRLRAEQMLILAIQQAEAILRVFPRRDGEMGTHQQRQIQFEHGNVERNRRYGQQMI